MPGMVFTPRRLSVLCSRLSSVLVVLCTAFFFLYRHAWGPILAGPLSLLPSIACGPQLPTGGLWAAAACRATPCAVAHLRTVPLPPVRTTPAIFCRRSTFICRADGGSNEGN